VYPLRPGGKDDVRCIYSEIVLRRLVYEIDIIVSDCEKRATLAHVDDSRQNLPNPGFFPLGQLTNVSQEYEVAGRQGQLSQE
jgi:hypothetical protein